MDAEFLSAMQEGADAAEAMMGEPVTYLGATYNAIVAQSVPISDMLNAGYKDSQEWTIKATVGQFAAAPVAKKEITVRGMVLFIKSVDTDATHYTLVCGKR